MFFCIGQIYCSSFSDQSLRSRKHDAMLITGNNSFYKNATVDNKVFNKMM